MNNLPLTLFSLLAQASVGLYIINALWNLKETGRKSIEKSEYNITLVSFILAAAGMAASFAHLAYPANSINALHNLESSWMSREILSMSIYLVSLFTTLLTRWGLLSKKLIILFRNLSFASAIILMISIIKVYTLPGLTNIDSPMVVISFISTTIFAGCSFLVLLNLKDYNRSGNQLFLAGIALSVSLLSFLASHDIKIGENQGFIIGIICYTTSFLALIPALIPKFKNIFAPSAVIFIILGLVSEFINRLILLSLTAYNI